MKKKVSKITKLHDDLFDEDILEDLLVESGWSFKGQEIKITIELVKVQE